MVITMLQNHKKLVGVLIGLLFILLRWQVLTGMIWANAGMVEINQYPAWRSIFFEMEAPKSAYVQRAAYYNPGRVALWRGLGLLHFAQGQPEQALSVWQGAGLEPAQVAAVQGRYADSIEQYDVALAWFAYAVELDPGQAEAWHELGRLQHQAGQNEAAIAAYGQAFALGYADSANPLAKIWRDARAYEMALEAWLAALHTFPEHPDRVLWWQGLTNGLRATEQWEVGVNASEVALKEFPEDATLHVEYAALIYRHSGDVDTAMNAIERAVKLDESTIGAYNTAASIMAAEGKYMSAYNWYAKAAERDAQNPSWFVAQGNMARAAGELSLALSVFETAIVRFPDFAPAHYGIALVHQQLGEKENAANAITRALQSVERQDVQYYLRAGEIYVWSGNAVEAIAAYQQALDIDPDNALAAAALQRLLGE